jgi:hypothetical protein
MESFSFCFYAQCTYIGTYMHTFELNYAMNSLMYVCSDKGRQQCKPCDQIGRFSAYWVVFWKYRRSPHFWDNVLYDKSYLSIHFDKKMGQHSLHVIFIRDKDVLQARVSDLYTTLECIYFIEGWNFFAETLLQAPRHPVPTSVYWVCLCPLLLFFLGQMTRKKWHGTLRGRDSFFIRKISLWSFHGSEARLKWW